MKVVRRIHAHIDVREAAQHIQDVVRAPPVDDEADAAGAYLRVRPAGFREGVGDVAVDLEAEVIVEVEREPAATAELVVELELLVVAAVAPEAADLELVGMLGPQGPGPGRQQYPDDSDCPHGRLLVGKSDPQNRGFCRKTRYPFALSLETLKVLEVKDGTIVAFYPEQTPKNDRQIKPNRVPTRLKACSAKSRSSRVWAADSWQRTRAWPCGTTGWPNPVTNTP